MIATVVAAALLVAYACLWAGVSNLDMARSDFTAFDVGSSLLRAGHGAAIYDQALQAHMQGTLVAPLRTANLPFVSPPAAAAVLVPLTALPLAAAYRLWQAVQLLMLVAAVVIAVRAAPWQAPLRRPAPALATAVVALAGVGTLVLGLLGQWDGVSALGVAGAYALWRRDARLAGGAVLAACTLLAKPHLMLGVAALLLGWRDRRVLAGAGAAILVLALASLALVGPAGIHTFVAAVLDDAGRWAPASMLGFSGLTGSWLGGGALAQVVAGAASIGALAACVALGRRLAADRALLEPALAGAMVLSLLATPHLLAQDLVLLAPLFAALTAWAAARDSEPIWTGRRGRLVLMGWAALAATAGLDLGAQSPAPPGRLVPWALLLLAAGAAWLCGRGSAVRASPASDLEAATQGRGNGLGVSPEYS